MAEPKVEFKEAAEAKAFNREHRQRINHNIAKYESSLPKGFSQFSNIELAKSRAAYIKRKVVDNLERYLIEWESNFKRNGGKVVWAATAEEAVAEILAILKRNQVTSIVKSKSMVTEEIHLNKALELNGIEPVETDLGEYIQQLDGEPPYHIVTPAMHKSKEDIAQLFHHKLGMPLESTPEEMTLEARRRLREKYTRAGAGISGGNFLLADTGSVVLVENEGNARLSTTFPPIHIAIVGIEKLLPSIADLGLFLPLLATHGTGQWLTNYNTIISGPKRKDEPDGPSEMYVVLLDNGRSNLLAEVPQREALACIRCGACLNVCPVYKNIGGHSYASPYSGPIGSVITPHFHPYGEFVHLSYASSLCGACTATCPVKIDIHGYLLKNRQKAVADGLPNFTERMIWRGWQQAMLSRKMMNGGRAGAKNWLLRTFFGKQWGGRRALPVLAPRSFNQQWAEKRGMKKG